MSFPLVRRDTSVGVRSMVESAEGKSKPGMTAKARRTVSTLPTEQAKINDLAVTSPSLSLGASSLLLVLLLLVQRPLPLLTVWAHSNINNLTLFKRECQPLSLEWAPFSPGERVARISQLL